ncbi:ROK family protein [Clostridium uliginosum]|uniref:Sugar kinase of the NBD/HSP70 family, may contain an N-terminal HTH domain n=1 Tax=Clostridium uliginosum TaxID=119641 RepID=A0A1I1LTI2_9CLOT|nr:ROK family protein [Clostridium uliginosum]SFC76359.1 Sugar kinase of the NBD/HSP70 family, may contain an N-terminal HTH domain [Clostridium uliginosum]
MNNLSGKPQVMKKVNSALIKQILKEKGSATKAQITENTGISTTTVRTLLEELIINKQIISLGLDDSSGGRRAERYTLNLDDNISLSFYIENEFINYALTNPLGDIIENKTVKIEKNNHEKSLEKIIDKILKDSNIKVIGIGISGVVDKGNYFSGKELTDWKKFNIGEYIEEKYTIPVVLENNLNAIALGFSLNYLKEMKTLNMKSLNLVYIHFTEDGVGAGIIANGQLIRGENNFAGELGFIPINNHGHLEHILNNNPSDETYVNVVSHVIAILNCVINPSFIVIGGTTLRKNLLDKIKNNCKNYLANNIIPEIILSKDSKKDYLAGITYLATEFMYSDIKLTKKQI